MRMPCRLLAASTWTCSKSDGASARSRCAPLARIGGNIANGSPIGDWAPCLIALGATMTLQRGEETRSLPVEAFFLAYGRQDRRASEFVRAVNVPKLGRNQHFHAFKVSKRFDEDISAVMLAMLLELDGAAW